MARWAGPDERSADRPRVWLWWGLTFRGRYVEDWLTAIGLGHRIGAFRDNGITLDQLPELTEGDLRELGLTIGERKLLRRALASQPALVRPIAPPTHPTSPPQAEHRPLSVMFIDLVGSTGIGERLDAEDLLDLTRTYRAFCGSAISRFGGSAVRFVGDGILAYFGYPIAHENDPERAVRAALEITRGIGALSTPAGTPLAVRIGIATGSAVVGDLDAGGLLEQHSATGSVLNLAARLQSLARCNGIVIAEQTHTRVAGLFDCEPLGSVELNGFAAPRQPWRVIAERARSARTEHSTPRLTRFHGREAELAVLRAELERAASGQGRAVLVLGEPGIGKSRLVEQLALHHLPAGTRLISLVASMFDEDRPLGPLIDRLRTVSGLDPADERAVGLGKVAAVLAGSTEQRKRALPILAELAGLPIDHPGRPTSPEELRRETVAVIVEQLLAIAQAQPVCLVVEDLHWLDPTSRELLDAVLGRLAQARLFVVLTAREGMGPDWTERPGLTVLRLERLSRAEVAAMLEDLFGEAAAARRLLDRVVHRTDGVPLFVEEVARVLLDRQAESGNGASLNGGESALIPASLHESLVARLDRSGAAKNLAQVAAVAGRSVRRDVLARACEASAESLEEPLSALVETGILERHTRLGGEIFSFSHALVRDAAYDSLLRDRRRDLHRRIGRALQAIDPAGVARDPEMLALHLTEGGLAAEAAPHWTEAARRSLARSALTEATRMLRRALVSLEQTPASPNLLSLRIQVSALLGAALSGLTGPNSAETREHYTKAFELCQGLPEDPSHFPIYWGWWRLNLSVERAKTLLSRAVTGNDPGLMLQAHHCNWASHLNAGLFDRCCEHVEAGLKVYASGDFSHHARIYGNHDPKVCAHGARAQAWWMQGRLRSAMDDEIEALGWAERTRHLGSRVHAKGLTLLHRVYRRDYQEVFDRAGELLSFTAEHGVADHGASGLVFQGWVIAIQSDPKTGLRMIEEGLARQHVTATDEDYSVYLCLLGEALMAVGQPERAIEILLRERSAFERNGFQVWLPELVRVTGEAMLAADPTAVPQARQKFAEAAEIARTQNVPMLDLRIAVSETRLGLRLGEPDTASRLRAALDAIVENDRSADIIEAEQLLGRIPA